MRRARGILSFVQTFAGGSFSRSRLARSWRATSPSDCPERNPIPEKKTIPIKPAVKLRCVIVACPNLSRPVSVISAPGLSAQPARFSAFPAKLVFQVG